ncbi:MAG: single-stranded DNA-binding protein [Nitrospiraceae bacterium]|nr:single-stranded DNA-binding protein [Nitrospiraceae bacterium]
MSESNNPAAKSTPEGPKTTKPWNDRNQCRFTGRLGADLKINTIGKNAVVTGTIYVTNEYDNAVGERKKREARIGFVMYGDEAVAFAQTVGKGDRIETEGQIHGNAWTDTHQQKRYGLELTAYPEKSTLLMKFVPKEQRQAA